MRPQGSAVFPYTTLFRSRSVGFVDGLYKSTDGGKKFTHVGLKESEHIAKVVIDPRNTDVVYVASQGPLWKEGGEDRKSTRLNSSHSQIPYVVIRLKKKRK